MRGSQPPSSLVPRLHAITYRKLAHSNPLVPQAINEQGRRQAPLLSRVFRWPGCDAPLENVSPSKLHGCVSLV